MRKSQKKKAFLRDKERKKQQKKKKGEREKNKGQNTSREKERERERERERGKKYQGKKHPLFIAIPPRFKLGRKLFHGFESLKRESLKPH